MSFIPQRQAPPIESRDELVAQFAAASKPAAHHRVGVELEKLAVHPSTGAAVAYDGAEGIDAVLRRMAHFPCYESTYEGERLVLLTCASRTIGLEPGGQIELSGTPCARLEDVGAELDLHLRELCEASVALPISWLAIGEHPIAEIGSIPWVEKERYRILASFLESRGVLGHHMMKKTATIQASFDFESPEDAVRKLRAGLLFTPVLIALTANSPYANGCFTGFQSHRTVIWEQTDPTRSGRLPAALSKRFDIEQYVDHVLDLPIIFLLRGERWHAPNALTFRAFLDRGWQGERATLYDWELHLSTFFPDVRVKKVVEIRGADCPPRRLFVPTIAWLTGLLYSAQGLTAVEDVLGHLTPEQHADLQRDAAREGLGGKAHGVALRDAARDLLAAARRGLAERAGLVGVDEGALLDPLAELVERGKSPAQDLVDRFGEVIDDPAALVRATAIC